jgi:glycosyltransferase involved in cell wall biosynthesis
MISVVTPSFNQAAYLPAAIRSVLSQDAELEYIVIDGGSTDGSVDIIRQHEDRLAAWRSEPDGGQYDALNKGFALSSGEIMGWLNSDDFYFPGALSVVETVFAHHPEIEWITGTTAVIANAHGQTTKTFWVGRFSRRAFFRGYNLPLRGWHAGHFIPQESTFWRRSLWERAGGELDASLTMAGDFDLWARFYQHAELWGVRTLIGAYRSQPAQKTAVGLGAYLDEAERVLRRHGARPYGKLESSVRDRLNGWVGDSVYRLPTPLRNALEERGLVYRVSDLGWKDPWVVGSTYFI